jgi:uncharacterized protein
MATGVAAAGLAAYLARRVVTPQHEHLDDVEVLGVGAGTLTLRATSETSAPGRYGIWLQGGSGHVRVGRVIDHDVKAGTVTREVVGVDAGRLVPGSGRWNQYYFWGAPDTALGLPYRDVEIDGELGPLPAWLVPPADPAQARGTWAILIHGRGATREECLRAVPVLTRLGLPSLAISYRNDPGAPRSVAGRYRLGDAEWLDVEAAVVHALREGARRGPRTGSAP